MNLCRSQPRSRSNSFSLEALLPSTRPVATGLFAQDIPIRLSFHQRRVRRLRVTHQSTMIESWESHSLRASALLHYAESIAVDIWPLKSAGGHWGPTVEGGSSHTTPILSPPYGRALKSPTATMCRNRFTHAAPHNLLIRTQHKRFALQWRKDSETAKPRALKHPPDLRGRVDPCFLAKGRDSLTPLRSKTYSVSMQLSSARYCSL